MIRKLSQGAALLALMALPVAAGPLEDGQAAYDKGDYKTAAQDFTVAASQGDDTARAHLGTMFAYGIGLPEDAAQAQFWLGLAAEHNNPEADTMMGKLAMDGRFVKQDPDLAMSFFQRAAVQGNALAQTYLGELYMKGTPKVKADYAAAFRNFGLAANQNVPEAEYYIGFFYYTGQFGQKQDYQASLNWFIKAADQGNSAAQTFAGTQYDKGMGTGQDSARAILYYRMAAAQGNLQGMALLGEHYAEGSGVTADNQRAYLFLNLSAGQIGSVMHDVALKARDAAAAKISPAQLASAQKLGAFCATNNAWLLCLDDTVAVDAAAADPQGAATKLAARIRASQPSGGQNGESAAGNAQTAASSDGKLKYAGNGTGFFVSANGDLVTAAHVTAECPVMRVGSKTLTLVAQDRASDVALLSTGAKSPSFFKLRGQRGPRVGEPVVVVGYPLQGVLGEDPIVTTGIISSLAGLQNDRRQIQFSAPIQPGNSGGPVMGEDGAIVGVAVSTISTLDAAKEITGGTVPENVNFASSVGTLQSFLNGRHVDYVLTDGKEAKHGSADLADTATRATVMIECWK